MGVMLDAGSQGLLGQEWVTLQNNHALHERAALALKLATVVLTVALLAVNLPAVVVGVVVVLLWLQEGIFRTTQSRLGQRLLRVEHLIRQGLNLNQGQNPMPEGTSAIEQGTEVVTVGESAAPFQLHSQWMAARPGGLGLLREYALSACRPTVAYPYAVIVLGLAALTVLR